MESNQKKRETSYDYIRGLIDGEGCFSFSTVGYKDINGNKKKLPAFMLSMSKRDEALINKVKDKLKIRNEVHVYTRKIRRDSYNRQPMAILIIRDLGQIKNIIVPLCYKKLIGNKAKQFEEWIEKIGLDQNVSEPYRIIYKLCKSGFYDREEVIKRFD